MSEPGRVDASAVASAAGSLVTRTLGGVALGLLLGVVVFVLERSLGWLDAEGWRRIVMWLMLPLYAVGGAAALGFIFAVGAVRNAAARLLVDSGALRRMVERGLARVRRADQQHAEPEAAPAPRGWLGRKLHGIGDRVSRVIVERLRSTAAPEAETARTIEATARLLIDEWSETPVYLTGAALALLFAVPPFLL
jgi:hypothetical protein